MTMARFIVDEEGIPDLTSRGIQSNAKFSMVQGIKGSVLEGCELFYPWHLQMTTEQGHEAAFVVDFPIYFPFVENG